MKRLLTLFKRPWKSAPITVVSGLPRSGTSMMMKILEAGGMPLLTDNIREADEDNPKGYYEYERVKGLDKGDIAWLADARGKVVKIISTLLPHLPPTYNYRIIFIHREMPEILASQRKMLFRRGKEAQQGDDEEMAGLFRTHLVKIENWLRRQSNIEFCQIKYNEILVDPVTQLAAVNRLLGSKLDSTKMIGVIDPSLYRQRKKQD
jgi:hypothetical protein